MNRTQLHQWVDELPEQDLEILWRMMQGLRATALLNPPPARTPASAPQSTHPSATQQVHDVRTTQAQTRPEVTRIQQLPQRETQMTDLKGQLAQEYGRMMRQGSPDENSSVLRKVMFTPLSELLSWVNQPTEPANQPGK